MSWIMAVSILLLHLLGVLLFLLFSIIFLNVLSKLFGEKFVTMLLTFFAVSVVLFALFLAVYDIHEEITHKPTLEVTK